MTVSLPATAPGRTGSGLLKMDGPRWVDRLNRLLHHEIRAAVADDILTSAEAEQLRARLVLVIDQAITPAQPCPQRKRLAPPDRRMSVSQARNLDLFVRALSPILRGRHRLPNDSAGALLVGHSRSLDHAYGRGLVQ